MLSRMLPEVFRDCRVQRLAPFFQAVRETLRRSPRTTATTRGSSC